MNCAKPNLVRIKIQKLIKRLSKKFYDTFVSNKKGIFTIEYPKYSLCIMFYKLIERKRNEWYDSDNCAVSELVQYIVNRGKMRDAQIEAIKTYLFLKIACQNRPLQTLFAEGVFNSLNVDSMELTSNARAYLSENPAAVALLEYSMQETKDGKSLAPSLEAVIKKNDCEIDFKKAFEDFFYGVNYADYLFSLPMGAGKTYLMAAFIYIDLYFAQNEPENPAFAHNFMILAPSGLKSSIVPSLRTIKDFDPSWVIPEPAASEIKRIIRFEVLDEQKSASKSNRVKNPNAQKINLHLSFPNPMGLVAVTNAEKVILDRVDEDDGTTFLSEDEAYKVRLANELRETIGKIPNLSIFIDEVHHAADGEIKLRKVVNSWSEKKNFCGMLGFSGTPYLEKAETIEISEKLKIKNSDLSNVVYYYPLIDGIGNFLKKPDVKYAAISTEEIIRCGVEEFFSKYRDTVYSNGTCAKLAIYCGQIEPLEKMVYPLVAGIVSKMQLNPTEVILKYHGGNAQFPQPEGSATEFASLDTSISKIRVVLLAQIGKEGWDCKSLTGVILPQKGACPDNMILQTSCRCLRQIERNANETALIWLNDQNATVLNKQLQKQQNISLKEFGSKQNEFKCLKRYSRMDTQKVPPIDFYQLKVSYETLVVEDGNDVQQRLQDPSILVSLESQIGHSQDMQGNVIGHFGIIDRTKTPASFTQWMHTIAKESFGTLKLTTLLCQQTLLKRIYDSIVVQDNGKFFFSPKFDHKRIRSLIRQSFIPKREIQVNEEVIESSAKLLRIENFASTVAETDSRFYPKQDAVESILKWDDGSVQTDLTPEQKALLEQLSKTGVDVSSMVPSANDPHPERKQSYHYLPYHFDSNLEVEYFSESILPMLNGRELEIYFNGDDSITEFKIRCYHHDGAHWQYIGMYVPDFLLIKRDENGGIYKVIIIETKGEGFAAKFADRRDFMQNEFLRKNNEKFGYKRFDFLYLEDTLTREQREKKTLDAINNFFNA